MSKELRDLSPSNHFFYNSQEYMVTTITEEKKSGKNIGCVNLQTGEFVLFKQNAVVDEDEDVETYTEYAVEVFRIGRNGWRHFDHQVAVFYSLSDAREYIKNNPLQREKVEYGITGIKYENGEEVETFDVEMEE